LFFSSEFPRPEQPERAIFNLRMCEALAARHDVRVFSPVPWTEPSAGRKAGPIESISHVAYHTYYFLPRVMLAARGRFMWWSLRRHLLSMTDKWRPDVVLAYWAHPDGEAALSWRRRSGIPVVQVVGGSDVLLLRDDPRRWLRILRVLTSADAVVTIGHHLAREVTGLGVPSERVFGVHRPVNAGRFTPGSKKVARHKLRLPDDQMLLWVGRFVKVKGLDVLIDAFAQLHSARPGVRLCLVGEGPEAARIKARVAALGLAEAVVFAGPVPHGDLVDWFRAADLTVLPSLSEGVPNVLLESIACGVPFVASQVGGIPEIADPQLDRLVPAGDPSALAAAVAELLDEPGGSVRTMMPGDPERFALQLEAILVSAIASASALNTMVLP
jgi:glycosyltransferase involved in cell wall biosynthesis